MTNPRWALIDDALAAIGEEHCLPQAYIGAIAERLENALASDRKAGLQIADAELTRLLRALLDMAPAEVRAANRGAAPSDALALTFQLGQIGFAQHIAASAFARRVDDRLISTIKHKRYERYVRALIEKPLDGVQMREKVGQSKENVSRVLGLMRGLGIVDSRKEGSRVVNFLTPNAKAVVEELNMSPLPNSQTARFQSAEIVDLIKMKTSILPHKLQTTPTFKRDKEVIAECDTRFVAS